MKVINAFFVLYPKKNKQAAGHAKRQAENIDERENFIATNISPRNC